MKATATFLNQVLEADHGDTPITLRALIPAFLSGACIGKGGETHRELERQFGTNIYFGTENARGTRLASVAGTIQKVARTWRECAFLMYRRKDSMNGKVGDGVLWKFGRNLTTNCVNSSYRKCPLIF